MYEREKEIINESFQFFLSRAIEVIEDDYIQRVLFQVVDDFKYGRGPGFIRIKDFNKLDDPCLWLLAKTHHPEDVLEVDDPHEQMIMSRVYEIVIVSRQDDYDVKSAWSILKPFEPNILHCSLMAQWVSLPNDEYIDVSDFESEQTETIIYTKDSYSIQKV